MKELEVGMYVRTTYGRIYKIKKVETKKVYYSCNPLELQWQDREFVYSESGMESETAISKASNNIIDLIEVGDYVNGWRVNRVEKEEDGTLLTVGTITSFVSRNEKDPYLTQDYREADKMCKIKSIVTKEQFDSMKYVVGDKE